jgi:glycosyltransferase involved in cell wall biosynthesis
MKRKNWSALPVGTLKKYKIQPGSILVIGNGMLHKNLGVLLKISSRLKRKLLFIGVSDSKQRFWKSKYPESDSTWVSYASDEDIPDIIKGCFCLAQPSTAEGYGLPPLEAMACGIPSVVSNIPVLTETTGHNTLTANPEDPEEWKIAIESLEDRELYQNLIKNGLEWVKPLRGKRGWDGHISDIANLIGRE